MAQNPSDRDNTQVQHFSRKQRMVAWISQTFFDNNVYRSRQGLTKGLMRKGGLAFLPEALARVPETEEIRFWRQLDLKDKVVYDVGAFHGLLTCFFAKQARHVVAYEPTPPTHERLIDNVRLNKFTNVTLRKCGVASQSGSLTMMWNPLTPGASKSSSPDAALPAGNKRETVPVVRLDEDIAAKGLPKPEFIKVDVEGMELDVLKGAEKTLLSCRPTLFLEMHGETMKEKREKTAAVVDFLLKSGYRDIVHIESGTAIDAANSAVAANGHLYCRP